MSTGTFPGSTTYPGSTLFPDPGTPASGIKPLLRAYIDLSGAPSITPNWNALPDAKMRAFSISRGRESELSEFDAGTATLVMDNRDRAFDPSNASSPYYPNIRPLTRFWLQAEIGGVLYDLFVGYAESFQQAWPDGGWSDSICTISLVDEFKVLSLATMLGMSPPRDTYGDVVMFDGPVGSWTHGDLSTTMQETARVGPTLNLIPGASGSSLANFADDPIIGESGFSTRLESGVNWGYLSTGDLNPGEPGDASGLSQFTIETWYKSMTVTPATNQYIVAGPQSGGNRQWSLILNTGGGVQFGLMNSITGGIISITMPGGMALASGVWYHLVGVLDGSFLRLFSNGVEVATSGGGAWTGVIADSNYSAGTADMFVGDPSGTITDSRYKEMAVYRYNLNYGSRVLAHYNAGRFRGFIQQTTGDRINTALNAASSAAPRVIAAGTRSVTADFMRGRPPLDAIRDAVQVEAVDAAFFVDKSGNVTFLDSTNKTSGVGPYSTVQAIFDDDGTDNAYLDVGIDYSDSFIANEWNVTRDGGETKTASDSTSIGKYFKRSQSLTGLLATTDTSSNDIAVAMLAKYKDPMTRITSISFDTSVSTIAAAVFARDLCHMIRVLRTTPGGARLDQSLWIQKIEIAGDNTQAPWSIKWVVSPL